MEQNTKVNSVKASGSESSASATTRRLDVNLVDPRDAAEVSENAIFTPSSELGALVDIIGAANENIDLSDLNALVESKAKSELAVGAFKPVIAEQSDLDKLVEEEATAAGLTAGAEDGGHSFVVLDRVVEPVTPIPYAFPTNPTGTPPEIKGESAPEQNVSSTPPVDPPPVDPVLPTVSVDIEVDPDATYLKGKFTSADTVEITITGSDGSEHKVNAILNADGTWTADISGISFSKDVTYTAHAVATNKDGTASADDVDSYTVVEPPPPPEQEPGKWFIAQADNHDRQSSPDKSIDEGGKGWDFTVVYQGNGNYDVKSGETVTVTLDLWIPTDTTQAEFLNDFNLDVTGLGQFTVTGWKVENGQLVVTIAVGDKFDHANLTGNVFDVTVTAVSDTVLGDNGELIGFDINSATHTTTSGTVGVGTAWETNDDVLVTIVDTTQTPPVDPPPVDPPPVDPPPVDPPPVDPPPVDPPPVDPPPVDPPPVDPPPVDPPPVDPPPSENWFISHQGNKNFDQAINLNEGDAETFNVQFQDRSGEHIGIVHAGDTVDIKIAITGDPNTLNLLDILNVDPSNEFSATWNLDGNTLDVLLTNISGRDANLQGNPFDVTFDVKSDNQTGTNNPVTFDIESVTVGGVWESNDQANYIINDLIAKGGGNPHSNG